MSNRSRQNQNSRDSSTSPKYAYVTAVFGNKGYVVPAVAMAKSLRRVTQYPIICIHYGLDSKDLSLLRQYFDQCTEITTNFKPSSIMAEGENMALPSVISENRKYLSIPDYVKPQDRLGKLKSYLWRVVITRWTALRLTKFDKIILLDADTYFFSSVDDLFIHEPPAIVVDHRKDNTLVNKSGYNQFYKYDQRSKMMTASSGQDDTDEDSSVTHPDFNQTDVQRNLIRTVENIPQNSFNYLKSIHYNVLGCEGSMILLRPDQNLFYMLTYAIQGTIWDLKTYKNIISSASRPDEVIPLIILAELGLQFKTIPFNYMVQQSLYDKLSEEDRKDVKAIHFNDVKPWYGGEYTQEYLNRKENEIRRPIIEMWENEFPEQWKNRYFLERPLDLS